MHKISILIGHYDATDNDFHLNHSLKKQVAFFRRQKDVDLQIIVCDDGSRWSKRFEGLNSDETGRCTIVSGDNVCEVDCDYLVRINNKKGYGKPLLFNAAIASCNTFENILIMDDDWIYLNDYALFYVCSFLEKYSFVVSRIYNRIYNNGQVQGPGVAFRKKDFMQVGGVFNYYGGEDGAMLCGMDIDTWNMFYTYIVSSKSSKAAYIEDLFIIPLSKTITSRWKPYYESESYKKEILKIFNGKHSLELPCRKHSEWLESVNILPVAKNNKFKVLVWGVKGIYNQYKHVFSNVDFCFTDNDETIWGNVVNGSKVISPDGIKIFNPDIVCVCSSFFQEIQQQIMDILPNVDVVKL